MTETASWVDLAPTVDPVKTWLWTETGQTVSFGRAPKGGVPPFTVLQVVSDPRVILTLDGGIPVEVTWQLDSMGENPLQALALADKGARAMVVSAAPELVAAAVIVREAVGDMHGPSMTSEGHFVVQARYRWTLIAITVDPDTP